MAGNNGYDGFWDNTGVEREQGGLGQRGLVPGRLLGRGGFAVFVMLRLFFFVGFSLLLNPPPLHGFQR